MFCIMYIFLKLILPNNFNWIVFSCQVLLDVNMLLLRERNVQKLLNDRPIYISQHVLEMSYDIYTSLGK